MTLFRFPLSARAEGPFSAYVQVYDENGDPLAGINLRLDVITYQECPCPFGEGEEPPPGGSQQYFGSDTETTDSNGYAFLSVSSLPGSLTIMRVYRLSVLYVTILSQNASTGTANTIFPELHYGSDIDLNGFVDNWELSLAEKFCPTMVANPVLSTNKWLVPEPVEIVTGSMFMKRYIYPSGTPVDDIFLLTTEDWDYSWVETPMTWDDPPGGTLEYFVIYHFEWAGLTGNGPTAWENAYQSERDNNNYDHTIYAHLFKYDAQTYVIQYWFFYPYNDGYNDHEGDWEHINVLVTSQDPAQASLTKVDFYFHEKVQIRDYPDLEIEDGTHPIVYIGGTSTEDPLGTGDNGVNTGGSYPETGKWNNIGPLGADEYVFGVGPVISYSEYIDGNPNDGRGIIILKEPGKYDYEQNPEMSWLNADLPWGHITVGSPWSWQPFVEVGNHAPVGPAHNKGWNKIGSVSGSGGYDLYTALPGPLP